jgi:hypothetical protein
MEISQIVAALIQTVLRGARIRSRARPERRGLSVIAHSATWVSSNRFIAPATGKERRHLGIAPVDVVGHFKRPLRHPDTHRGLGNIDGDEAGRGLSVAGDDDLTLFPRLQGLDETGQARLGLKHIHGLHLMPSLI